ncbi:nucleoside hydrolase [Mesorhizobium sp. L-8-3]|uniref:nucleoside hydrolase n=1 Tax=Mesorhizobium sp. L-8-3 TaxID=2744522 RepID=UPI001927F730|nr:nucleoside hydrolase [Mesorhizobium sp. L-8-3]BCH22356.1 nucleoside hydrolase [Mesorhizobium sp. L-8-3]
MRKKILFDTDPGVDDAAALLFLQKHPDIELVGITTVFGNSDIDRVTRNALYLKERFGVTAPVARGAAAPLVRQPGPAPVMVHGENGLGDVSVPDMEAIATDPRPAWQFIIDMLRQNPGEITIVAVGRMTNLALALAEAPDIVDLVREVVIMGGAFAVSGHNGNVTPVAEANIIGDPHAADIVFNARWPVVAVGLDVTRQVLVTTQDLELLAREGGETGRLLADISEGYMRFYDRFGAGGFYLHDASAAALAIDRSLFGMRAGPVRVVTDGIAAGQTIQRDNSLPYPPNAWDGAPDQEVCVAIDAARVKALVMDTLLG